jgi:hypothetical protein
MTNTINLLQEDLEGDFMSSVPSITFIYGRGYLLPKYLKKQPIERRFVGFDCSTALSEGDSIASVVPTMYTEEGVAAPGLLPDTPTINGSTFYMSVSGGTSGCVYWLDLKVTGASGEVLNNDLRVVVREKGY